MISILMPIYNGIEFINDSVMSIIQQKYANWELIIGVNGHPPNSEVFRIAQKYEALQQLFDSVKEERNKMYQTEEERSSSYQHAINTLSKINDKIQAEKEADVKLAHQNELKKIAELKNCSF